VQTVINSDTRDAKKINGMVATLETSKHVSFSVSSYT